jgi:hypothetical protein
MQKTIEDILEKTQKHPNLVVKHVLIVSKSGCTNVKGIDIIIQKFVNLKTI